MNTLVYNRDLLKAAVVMLLDRNYGKARTERIRAYIKGIYRNRSWFNGKRVCLRELVDIARQPTGAIKVLDLLDTIDKRREAIVEEQRRDAPSVVRTAEMRSDCAHRRLIRITAAILTEELRRARVGEPRLTVEEKAAFIERKKEYWNRKTAEYIEEIRNTPGVHLRYPEVRRQAAERVLKEELAKLERAKSGATELSDSAKRHLNGKTVMWQRLEEAYAELKNK